METKKDTTISKILLLAVCLAALVGLDGFVPAPHGGMSSPEVTFSDPSPSGLHIMPASCASNYYHTSLPLNPDGLSYVSRTPQTENGADKFSTSVCVTNTNGNTFFVPAKTAAEFLSFKAVGTRIPGLSVQ